MLSFNEIAKMQKQQREEDQLRVQAQVDKELGRVAPPVEPAFLPAAHRNHTQFAYIKPRLLDPPKVHSRQGSNASASGNPNSHQLPANASDNDFSNSILHETLSAAQASLQTVEKSSAFYSKHPERNPLFATVQKRKSLEESRAKQAGTGKWGTRNAAAPPSKDAGSSPRPLSSPCASSISPSSAATNLSSFVPRQPHVSVRDAPTASQLAKITPRAQPRESRRDEEETARYLTFAQAREREVLRVARAASAQKQFLREKEESILNQLKPKIQESIDPRTKEKIHIVVEQEAKKTRTRRTLDSTKSVAASSSSTTGISPRLNTTTSASHSTQPKWSYSRTSELDKFSTSVAYSPRKSAHPFAFHLEHMPESALLGKHAVSSTTRSAALAAQLQQQRQEEEEVETMRAYATTTDAIDAELAITSHGPVRGRDRPDRFSSSHRSLSPRRALLERIAERMHWNFLRQQRLEMELSGVVDAREWKKRKDKERKLSATTKGHKPRSASDMSNLASAKTIHPNAGGAKATTSNATVALAFGRKPLSAASLARIQTRALIEKQKALGVRGKAGALSRSQSDDAANVPPSLMMMGDATLAGASTGSTDASGSSSSSSTNVNADGMSIEAIAEEESALRKHMNALAEEQAWLASESARLASGGSPSSRQQGEEKERSEASGIELRRRPMEGALQRNASPPTASSPTAYPRSAPRDGSGIGAGLLPPSYFSQQAEENGRTLDMDEEDSTVDPPSRYKQSVASANYDEFDVVGDSFGVEYSQSMRSRNSRHGAPSHSGRLRANSAAQQRTISEGSSHPYAEDDNEDDYEEYDDCAEPSVSMSAVSHLRYNRYQPQAGEEDLLDEAFNQYANNEREKLREDLSAFYAQDGLPSPSIEPNSVSISKFDAKNARAVTPLNMPAAASAVVWPHQKQTKQETKDVPSSSAPTGANFAPVSSAAAASTNAAAAAGTPAVKQKNAKKSFAHFVLSDLQVQIAFDPEVSPTAEPVVVADTPVAVTAVADSKRAAEHATPAAATAVTVATAIPAAIHVATTNSVSTAQPANVSPTKGSRKLSAPLSPIPAKLEEAVIPTSLQLIDSAAPEEHKPSSSQQTDKNQPSVKVVSSETAASASAALEISAAATPVTSQPTVAVHEPATAPNTASVPSTLAVTAATAVPAVVPSVEQKLVAPQTFTTDAAPIVAAVAPATTTVTGSQPQDSVTTAPVVETTLDATTSAATIPTTVAPVTTCTSSTTPSTTATTAITPSATSIPIPVVASVEATKPALSTPEPSVPIVYNLDGGSSVPATIISTAATKPVAVSAVVEPAVSVDSPTQHSPSSPTRVIASLPSALKTSPSPAISPPPLTGSPTGTAASPSSTSSTPMCPILTNSANRKARSPRGVHFEDEETRKLRESAEEAKRIETEKAKAAAAAAASAEDSVLGSESESSEAVAAHRRQYSSSVSSQEPEARRFGKDDGEDLEEEFEEQEEDDEVEEESSVVMRDDPESEDGPDVLESDLDKIDDEDDNITAAFKHLSSDMNMKSASALHQSLSHSSEAPQENHIQYPPSHTVRISVSCQHLPLSKSNNSADTIVVVSMKSVANGEFVPLAKTEFIRNCRNPAFQTVFEFTHRPRAKQVLKFQLFDVVDPSDANLANQQNVVGTVRLLLDHLVYPSIYLAGDYYIPAGTSGESVLMQGVGHERTYELQHEDPSKSSALYEANMSFIYLSTDLKKEEGEGEPELLAVVDEGKLGGQKTLAQYSSVSSESSEIAGPFSVTVTPATPVVAASATPAADIAALPAPAEKSTTTPVDSSASTSSTAAAPVAAVASESKSQLEETIDDAPTETQTFIRTNSQSAQQSLMPAEPKQAEPATDSTSVASSAPVESASKSVEESKSTQPPVAETVAAAIAEPTTSTQSSCVTTTEHENVATPVSNESVTASSPAPIDPVKSAVIPSIIPSVVRFNIKRLAPPSPSISVASHQDAPASPSACKLPDTDDSDHHHHHLAEVSGTDSDHKFADEFHSIPPANTTPEVTAPIIHENEMNASSEPPVATTESMAPEPAPAADADSSEALVPTSTAEPEPAAATTAAAGMTEISSTNLLFVPNTTSPASVASEPTPNTLAENRPRPLIVHSANNSMSLQAPPSLVSLLGPDSPAYQPPPRKSRTSGGRQRHSIGSSLGSLEPRLSPHGPTPRSMPLSPFDDDAETVAAEQAKADRLRLASEGVYYEPSSASHLAAPTRGHGHTLSMSNLTPFDEQHGDEEGEGETVAAVAEEEEKDEVADVAVNFVDAIPVEEEKPVSEPTNGVVPNSTNSAAAVSPIPAADPFAVSTASPDSNSDHPFGGTSQLSPIVAARTPFDVDGSDFEDDSFNTTAASAAPQTPLKKLASNESESQQGAYASAPLNVTAGEPDLNVETLQTPSSTSAVEARSIFSAAAIRASPASRSTVEMHHTATPNLTVASIHDSISNFQPTPLAGAAGLDASNTSNLNITTHRTGQPQFESPSQPFSPPQGGLDYTQSASNNNNNINISVAEDQPRRESTNVPPTPRSAAASMQLEPGEADSFNFHVHDPSAFTSLFRKVPLTPEDRKTMNYVPSGSPRKQKNELVEEESGKKNLSDELAEAAKPASPAVAVDAPAAPAAVSPVAAAASSTNDSTLPLSRLSHSAFMADPRIVKLMKGLKVSKVTRGGLFGSSVKPLQLFLRYLPIDSEERRNMPDHGEPLHSSSAFAQTDEKDMLNADEWVLSWEGKSKKSLNERSLLLSRCVICPGIAGGLFLTERKLASSLMHTADRCFSLLVAMDHRTAIRPSLDIICETEQQANEWLEALNAISRARRNHRESLYS